MAINTDSRALLTRLPFHPSSGRAVCAFGSQALYATRIDWESNRGRIEELYCASGKPLKEVVKVMAAERRFFATYVFGR